ncbi:MAG: hydrolase [Phycisphaerales bacterium]|jgi:nicotinamidase-related amidase|nr:hydrolase [Phycisphaerales bacterium]
MLKRDQAVLAVIDIQGKLASLIHDKQSCYDNIVRMIQAAEVLGIDVICTEQCPEKLGTTIPEISEHLNVTPISKVAFSCCGQDEFVEALKRTGRSQVILAGIETHICVYQTARDLQNSGYEVFVLIDAVSSRTEANRKLGLERMQQAGATLTSVEMALFEMLGAAEGDQFKKIARIVK